MLEVFQEVVDIFIDMPLAIGLATVCITIYGGLQVSPGVHQCERSSKRKGNSRLESPWYEAICAGRRDWCPDLVTLDSYTINLAKECRQEVYIAIVFAFVLLRG